MSQEPIAPRVERLLGELERREPAIVELGTPQLSEQDVAELVALGRPAVPALLERLPRASSRRLAHLGLALGVLGDRAAAGPLRQCVERLSAQVEKGPWDYAALAQCRAALERLDGSGEDA